ncbi:HTH domain-containing protein [Clostridioides sp. GD02404]|uniref:HTH domain-containing protein n=1 Tax=Clostridioides sp. GD02404 TaxID=3054354 RepID=UPI0038B1D0A9
MKVTLHTGELNFFREHEVAKNYIGDLFYLIEEYKFSMETVSILTNIDIKKLNEFYIGKGTLHYDELVLINSVVIMPFIDVFKTAKHNYEMIIKSSKKDIE